MKKQRQRINYEKGKRKRDIDGERWIDSFREKMRVW